MTHAKLFEYDEKDDFEEEEEIRYPRKPGEAPDGGWGWLVVLGAFICCAFVDGLIFSFDAMKSEIMDYYEETNESPVLFVAMVFGSFSLIGGPFTAALVNRFGSRKVAMAGSVVTCVALLVSTQMPSVLTLTVTYGFVAGFGMGMVHISAIVIVSQWFEHKRAFATGMALMGSGVGVLIFPPLYGGLIENNDWKNATVIIGALFLNCAVGGALFRPLTHAKSKGMKRGVIQRGAIMKALIAEKERQRTISNGSLDNCIITKDNRLIKIDKIDVKNKSNSYINRLKETFGFSSRSLNRSKNSLVVPKVVVTDPVYKGPKASPKPGVHSKTVQPAPSSTPPTPKRDSGCGSLDSPNLKSKSYEALPSDDPWDRNLVVSLPSRCGNVSVSDRNLTSSSTPKKAYSERLDPMSFPSCNTSPAGSSRSINTRASTVSNGRNFIPMSCTSNTSVMTVPSVHSVEMSTIYEHEELTDFKFLRKICKLFDLMLLKSPTFLLLLLSGFLTMFGFIIPYVHLPRKALELGASPNKAKFLISILWVANMIGRPILGWVADRPWSSSVQMNNILLFFAGVLSFFTKQYDNNEWMSFYAATFGLLTAAFLTLRSIMLIELFGKERLTSSFGLLTCFQGLALLAGYQLADKCEPDVAFYAVGALLVGAGLTGFPLNRVKKWEQERMNGLQIVNIEEIPAAGELETLHVEHCESSM